MNYDFSDKEFNLFIEIFTLISEFAKDKNLEAEGSGQYIRKALELLATTPYLKLGLEKEEDYSGLLTLSAAMEAIGSVSPSLLLAIESSTRIFGRMLSTWGSDAQKENLLAKLLEGKLIGTVALSEDAMNVDNDPLSTNGVADEEKIIIHGHKQYVINAHDADWFAVAGTMDGKNAVFLVEKNTEGLTIGEKATALGFQGVTVSGIALDNCAIPSDRVILPKDEKQMLNTLKLWENQVLIGLSLGLMKTAFESAKDYAKTHKTGGKPIIAYQEVGFKLSEMLTLFQTAQLFAYKAAWVAESDPKNAESLTLCAKVFCTESAEEVSAKAMNILGGAGFFSDNPVEQSYRYAKYGMIAGTSSEISRVKIGDMALGYIK